MTRTNHNVNSPAPGPSPASGREETSVRPRGRRALVAAVAFAFAAGGAAADEAPRTVASIAPVHSLLSGVVRGAAPSPELLVQPGLSPHHLQLTPSQVSSLHNAGLFFYIGGGGESFSRGLLESLPGSVRQIEFSEAPEITLLPFRSPDYLDARDDDHDDHGERDHHDEHEGEGFFGRIVERLFGHDDHNDEHKDEHDEHNGHDDHGHGARDTHIWLDTDRARLMVQRMARELGDKHPEKREHYEQNARKLDAKLAALDAEIAATLAGAGGKPFAVAHDAYQYFERKYGLAKPVAVQGGFAGALSAKRLSAARAAFKARDIRCIYKEPQLSSKYLDALAEGSGAEITVAVADPLGADIPPGEEHYFALMRQLAKAFAGCLQT